MYTLIVDMFVHTSFHIDGFHRADDWRILWVKLIGRLFQTAAQEAQRPSEPKHQACGLRNLRCANNHLSDLLVFTSAHKMNVT